MNKLYKNLYLKAEEDGYRTSDMMCKSVYREQKENQEELLDKIARVLLDNGIEDNKLKLNNAVRKALKKEFNSYIKNISKKEYKNERLVTEDILRIVIEDRYNKNSYITNLGIDYRIQKLTDEQIDKIVNEKIAGEVWSNRIWNNKKKLEKQLKKEVSGFLKGDTNINSIKKQIQKQFNQNAYNTKRLVETEVCRCQSSVNDVFAKEHGIKKQMYSATLDSRTCSQCAETDGKVFDVDDINKPDLPRHPLDRCCYINIPSAKWKPKTRLDNKTGKYIPYTTYEEWTDQEGIK